MIKLTKLQEKYGSEFTVVLLCCRVYFGSQSAHELEDFLNNNAINWDELCYHARLHRIRPTVYTVLLKADIPEHVKTLLKQEYLQLIQLNLKTAAETEKMIIQLRNVGITALPYKGVGYAKQFFGDLVSREISDIDLAINQEDASLAISILKTNGYSSTLADANTKLPEKYFKNYKDIAMVKYVSGRRELMIELHWGITSPFHLVDPRANLFLAQTGFGTVFSKNEVPFILPRAHFSAILLHHGLMDTFKYLKNLVDLTQAMLHPDIKKANLLISEELNTLGLKNLLPTANYLSDELLGISLFNQAETHHTNLIGNHFLNIICTGQRLFKNNLAKALNLNKDRYLLHDIDWFKYNWSCLRWWLKPGIVDFNRVELRYSSKFRYYIIRPFRSMNRLVNYYILDRRKYKP